MAFEDFSPKIAVIGLGYVGLPLAIALARHFPVLGFDINETRIQELQKNYDRTDEIDKEQLQNSTLRTSSQIDDLKRLEELPSFNLNHMVQKKDNQQANKKLAENLKLNSMSQDNESDQEKNTPLVFIVTVPTPVTKDNMPDLTPLKKASETVAKVLKKGSIVVFESTVYPGVTEDFCGPILEDISGLKAGQDFYLGYSPERINPGDKEHALERIAKVVSGQTDEIAQKLKHIYGKINGDNIFVAKNIKTAEAAKVIENAQRDINIAFINEIATIVGKLGISIYDVLAAAETKWNFIKFKPGLVGGHCIGVDPYYLADCARKLGHEPEVILSGRRINENMGKFIADSVHNALVKQKNNRGDKGSDKGQHQGHDEYKSKSNNNGNINVEKDKTRILVLGLTFKEGTSDLRNTKVSDVLNSLRSLDYIVDVHDPRALSIEAKMYLDEHLLPSLDDLTPYDCVLGAVPHKEYLNLSLDIFQKLLKPNGLLADLKSMWRHWELPEGIEYWSL